MAAHVVSGPSYLLRRSSFSPFRLSSPFLRHHRRRHGARGRNPTTDTPLSSFTSNRTVWSFPTCFFVSNGRFRLLLRFDAVLAPLDSLITFFRLLRRPTKRISSSAASEEPNEVKKRQESELCVALVAPLYWNCSVRSSAVCFDDLRLSRYTRKLFPLPPCSSRFLSLLLLTLPSQCHLVPGAARSPPFTLASFRPIPPLLILSTVLPLLPPRRPSKPLVANSLQKTMEDSAATAVNTRSRP